LELEEKYENLLIEIHESKSERFEKSHVLYLTKNGRNRIVEELDQLIKYEFVEFDTSDNSFYLTYEGYEEVEGIKEVRVTGNQLSELECQYSIEKPRKEKLWRTVGGLVITILAFSLVNGIKPNKQFELTPEVLSEIKNVAIIIMDSVKNEKVVNQINISWKWSGVVADKILRTNDFGNIIFKSDNEKIYRICPEELSIKLIASSIDEYELLISDQEFKIDWEMKRLVEIAELEIGELNDFEKYYLKIPAVISQDYSIENIGKIKFLELISVSGDLAYQINDLEDGQKVKLNITD